jgi:OOP family OmpA-OmpF porin
MKHVSMRRAAIALLTLIPAVALAQEFKLEGNKLVVPGTVAFETNGDKLKPESDGALDHVKKYLDAKSYVSLMRVEVHTDNSGNAAVGQALSEKRSLSVARALVGRGVDCKRLLPVGFGPNKPVAPNDSAEGRAQNRRVDFVNAELRGKAIGGMPVDGGGKVAGDPCK